MSIDNDVIRVNSGRQRIFGFKGIPFILEVADVLAARIHLPPSCIFKFIGYKRDIFKIFMKKSKK